MNFLGLRPGGWAFNFWHLFRFSMCFPKGAHSLGHRWGTGPRKYAITIFHYANPRGLIRWVTVGALDHESMLLQVFIVLPWGGSFVGSLGQWVNIRDKFNFPLCNPKGAHNFIPTLGRRPSKVMSSTCMTDFSLSLKIFTKREKTLSCNFCFQDDTTKLTKHEEH